MDPQFTFASGTTSNGDTRCFDIAIMNDVNFEGDQIIQVQIVTITPPSIAFGAGNTAPVTIQDDNGNLYS